MAVFVPLKTLWQNRGRLDLLRAWMLRAPKQVEVPRFAKAAVPNDESDVLRAGTSRSPDQAYAAFRGRQYFPALDGLRAISILLVLLHHTNRAPQRGVLNVLRTLQENGRYGVGCFFLISGFLICTLLLREAAQTGRVDLWKFYGRRALRLLPLYYAVLLGAAVLVFGLHQYSPANQELFRQKFPAYLFYYSNWLPTATQGPFFCAWSLAVEEQFYLVFGLLLCFAPRRWVIGLVGWALLIKIAVYMAFGAVDAHSELWRVAFSYREPVLIGVLVAFALHDPAGHAWLRRRLGPWWVAAGAAAGAAMWLLLHAMRHESAADAQLLYVVMAVVLVGLVVREHTPIIEGRLLRHIGRVSYGIYLLHLFVLNAVTRLAPDGGAVAVFVGSTMATIVLATLVHRYFEQPIIAFYKRRLAPTGRRPSNTRVIELEIVPAPVPSPTGFAGRFSTARKLGGPAVLSVETATPPLPGVGGQLPI